MQSPPAATIVGRGRPRPRAVAAAALAACLAASVLLFDGPSFASYSHGDDDRDGARPTQSRPRRRTTSSKPRGGSAVHPWARSNLLPPNAAPGPGRETVIFWHIPKSGGTTAKSIYKCVGMGKKTRVAPTPNKILQLKEWGLLEPGEADVVFTSSPGFAAEQLLNSTRKGRALALFRHPVERLVSKFYYLQVATWEPKYNPDWKDLDLLDWVRDINRDNNHMVKRLAGKNSGATEEDLQTAAKTLRRWFVVGLTDEMEESVRRFNAVMGIDEEDESVKRIMSTFFGSERSKRINSNPHPEIEEGSPAWDLLAEQNALDMRLYDSILDIFQEQRKIIDAHGISLAAGRALAKE